MSIVQFQEDQGITMSPVGFIPSCQQKDCQGFESDVDTERLSVCPVLMLDGHFIVYNIMGEAGIYIADRQGQVVWISLLRLRLGFPSSPLNSYMYTN